MLECDISVVFSTQHLRVRTIFYCPWNYLGCTKKVMVIKAGVALADKYITEKLVLLPLFKATGH